MLAGIECLEQLPGRVLVQLRSKTDNRSIIRDRITHGHAEKSHDLRESMVGISDFASDRPNLRTSNSNLSISTGSFEGRPPSVGSARRMLALFQHITKRLEIQQVVELYQKQIQWDDLLIRFHPTCRFVLIATYRENMTFRLKLLALRHSVKSPKFPFTP